MRRWWKRRSSDGTGSSRSAPRSHPPAFRATPVAAPAERLVPPQDAAHLRDWFDRLIDSPGDAVACEVVVNLISATPTRWLRRVDHHMRERSIYYWNTGRELSPAEVDAVAGDGSDRWDLLGLISMGRSGYAREAALERLAEGPTERTLRYELLRADDWVDAVQRRAMAAVLVALATAPPEAVLGALPAVWERLAPGARRGRAADFATAAATWLTDPAQRQTLLTAARSDDRWVRRLAVRTLFEVEDPGVVLTHARLDDDVMVATQVTGAYLAAPEPDRQVVMGLLESPFASIRDSAAFWLLNKDPNGPDGDLLQRVTTDRSRSVRFQAQALLRSGGTDPADWYRSRDPLRDPSVLRGLADVGSEVDEGLALAAMGSPLAGTRAAGVRLLATSPSRTATEALIRAVGDSSPGLGGPAALALRKRGISPQQTQQLTDQAASGDPVVARNTRRALMGLPRWPRLVAALRLAILDHAAGDEGELLLEIVVRQWERAATQPSAAELSEADALLDASHKPTNATWQAAVAIVDRAKPPA